ncbi:MAG TPA: hypothetical protein DGT23_17505 [Micromonosporaceae bacterium]|nr:hypothetical protein [Micromonosporaceae bacterium]
MQDAVKAYLELAFGLTEASKKKAEKTVKKVAKELAGKGGATAAQLQGLAEELLATGNANREAVTRLVRVEMDRALSRVGLATADELGALVDRIESLERQLRDKASEARATAAKLSEPAAATKAAPARKTIAKRAPVAKKAPVTKAATSDVPTAAKKAPAKRSPAKTAAKKTTAARSTAAKSTAAKSTATKATL